MKRKLEDMTVDELVDQFAKIGIAQDEALLDGEIDEVNRLMHQLRELDMELRARGKEARLALLHLYDHPNVQVRLNAAKLTLGVAPVEACKVIEAVSQSGYFPQAGDAGMTLRALDDGIFKPD